jgi:hypothetical protein
VDFWTLASMVACAQVLGTGLALALFAVNPREPVTVGGRTVACGVARGRTSQRLRPLGRAEGTIQHRQPREAGKSLAGRTGTPRRPPPRR